MTISSFHVQLITMNCFVHMTDREQNSKALSSKLYALYNSIYTPTSDQQFTQTISCSLDTSQYTSVVCILQVTTVIFHSQSLVHFSNSTPLFKLIILCCNFQLFNFPSQIFINNSSERDQIENIFLEQQKPTVADRCIIALSAYSPTKQFR